MILRKLKYRFKLLFQDILFFFGMQPNFSKRNGELQVICLHGVCEDHEPFINGRFIKKTELEQLFIALKENFNCVSWADVEAKKLCKSKLNVLITFDDGYLNNKTLLLPIITAQNIPIILFVTGRDGNPMWMDLLDCALEKKCSLRNLEHLIPTIDQLSNQEIKQQMLKLSTTQIDELNELLPEIMKDKITDNGNFWKLLVKSDIIELAKNPLVTFGNHTKNHYNLLTLSKEEIMKEYEETEDYLKECGIVSRKLIAYPFGKTNEEIMQCLELEGCNYHFLLSNDNCEENQFSRLVYNPFTSINNNLIAILNGKF